jgi:hypothetical protein
MNPYTASESAAFRAAGRLFDEGAPEAGLAAVRAAYRVTFPREGAPRHIPAPDLAMIQRVIEKAAQYIAGVIGSVK